MTSPTAPGVIRKWTRLQDYNDEVAMARIYAGFHYRFSTVVGKDHGQKNRRVGGCNPIAPCRERNRTAALRAKFVIT